MSRHLFRCDLAEDWMRESANDQNIERMLLTDAPSALRRTTRQRGV
jgi:hypothetical protein